LEVRRFDHKENGVLSMTRTACVLTGLLSLLAGWGSAAADEAPTAKDKIVIQLGIPDTLFRGVPDYLKQPGAAPFLKMMKAQTGLDGKVNFIPNPMTVAEQLNANKMQIAVFQGHEFALAREKYHDLIPIAITDPFHQNQSFCVVSWDCKARNIGQLAQGNISLPAAIKDYCELHLAKMMQEHMKGKAFKGQLKAAQSVDAIDDVINGKALCAIVDATTLKFYENLYPGQFRNTKILCQSEVFPNACIAVKKGQLDDKTIANFKKALFNAPNDPTGNYLLSNWKLKGFTKVPDDYDLQLKSFLKNYASTAKP
jgi:ABC-type phosphate/phosphonate transport system substrate-binding protein